MQEKADEVMEDVDITHDQVVDAETEERNRQERVLAEARRAEEEANAAAAVAAEAEAEAEAARRLEEDRRMVEEAQAQAHAQAQAQAQADAEAARQAEEKEARETARLAQEAEHAKNRRRNDVFNALPSNIAHVLRPNSSFRYESALESGYIQEHFTPLLLVKGGLKQTLKDGELSDQDSWVVNVQAAPLLGKKGLELLFRHEDIASDKTFSRHWNTYSAFSAREKENVDRVLHELIGDSRDTEMSDAPEFDDFGAEMAWLAAGHNAADAAKRRLHDGTIALYCVRLADVMENLDPLFHTTRFRVQPLDWIHQSTSIAKEMDKHGVDSFIDRSVQGFWQVGRREMREVDRTFLNDEALPAVHGSTDVAVVRRSGVLPRSWRRQRLPSPPK